MTVVLSLLFAFATIILNLIPTLLHLLASVMVSCIGKMSLYQSSPFVLIRRYIPAPERLSRASAAAATERHGATTDHPVLPLVQSRGQKPCRKPQTAPNVAHELNVDNIICPDDPVSFDGSN